MVSWAGRSDQDEGLRPVGDRRADVTSDDQSQVVRKPLVPGWPVDDGMRRRWRSRRREG